MTDLKYNYSDIVYKNDNFFAIKDEKKAVFGYVQKTVCMLMF